MPPGERDTTLGAGWQNSNDRAWTTSGDADGFHVLVASASEGYRWRTAATLSEPGFDTDQWIGNACVTGSGERAVVSYAPRTFTNKEALAERGAFTAIVDLKNGAVKKLPVRSSLAYFSPGCGSGEIAVLTQEGTESLARTRLIKVEADTGSTQTPIEVAGQLTSSIPVGPDILAADSGALVRVSNSGERDVLSSTVGVPFRLAADADHGIVYLEHNEDNQNRATVKYFLNGRTTTVATGDLTSLDVTSSRGGQVFVTGVVDPNPRIVSDVKVLDAPKGARVSTDGQLAVEEVQKTQHADPREGVDERLSAQPLAVTARVIKTGKRIEHVATLDVNTLLSPEKAAEGRMTSPSLASSGDVHVQSGDPNNPADFAERYCSVPRNDPHNQAMQPKPRQVEWAVDQAVRDSLDVLRPANWKNLGMPAYTPQGLFPSIGLAGGGQVPAQIMLGIAAQESNMWQAARSAVPGVTANPLIGNYYGIDYYNDSESDDWSINWSDADCGYGITQVTDGMRLQGREKPGETALPYDKQRAVALDFAANIAAGLRILQTKWNETHQAGLVVNNGDPSKIENWFFAVWAYNSGFYPNNGSGAWGVGWLNNPVNPRYPANRDPFLEFSYSDAAHPQDWPYPEKVLGWAGHPIESIETPGNVVAGYRPAWWNGDATTGPLNRQAVKPPVNQFCDSSNQCEPGAQHLPTDPDVVGEPAGPCAHQNSAGQYDLKCWYHQASTWKPDCSYSCGNELLRFDPGYAYQEDATSYAPNCTLAGLPNGALVIDDVADDVPSVRPNCGHPWANAGTFTLSYKSDASGYYPGKVDTHQIGGGFGGHFWFTHTRKQFDELGKLEVNATWRLSQAHTGPMQVLVALPDHGAHTNLATYTVRTSRGDRQRVVRQPGDTNRWVSLGTFLFDGVPEVSVTSVTPDGNGEQDIAFDALAFVPITGTFHEESVEAVAVFDEDQNIDTAAPGSWLGGPLSNRQALYDWALSRANAVLGMPDCDSTVGDCLLPATKQAVQAWREQVLAAGTDTVTHPDGNSIARWIGFANSYLDRPMSDQRPASFDDDGRYKIRTKATVSFVTDNVGKIVPGSEWTVYENRTGDTHLPQFVLDLLRALADDYRVWGVTEPDLSYQMPNLNAHDGAWTSVDPMVNGVLPGRAYSYSGKAPALTTYAGDTSDVAADCVAALTVAGGSIGYRPMLSQSGPVDAMQAFSDKLYGDSRIARPVADLVEDIRELFFDNGPAIGAESSLFNAAPPIWQELNFRACADGSIRPVSDIPILRASWMPDQYLYHNSKAMDAAGNYSGSSAPVLKGDFNNFSKIPLPGDSPYNQCGPASGRYGNPWNIALLDPPGVDPSPARFCLDPNLASDPSHSSP